MYAMEKLIAQMWPRVDCTWGLYSGTWEDWMRTKTKYVGRGHAQKCISLHAKPENQNAYPPNENVMVM